MKKRSVLFLLPVIAVFFFSSCAIVPTPMGPVGLFADVTYNAAAASVKMDANSFSKVGTSDASNILGIIQTGDISINAAMKSGGLQRVHHVDYKVTNVLGLFSTKTIIVYGE